VPSIKVEASTTIRHSIGDVWKFLSDLDTLKQWDPETVDVSWRQPLGIGDTFVITAEVLGRRTSGVARVTEYETNRCIGWKVEEQRSWLRMRHTLRVAVRYSVEPLESSATRLTRLEHATVIGPLFRLAWPVIAWRAKADRAEEIENVRRILETAREPSL
jgi:hypothetical protein